MTPPVEVNQDPVLRSLANSGEDSLGGNILSALQSAVRPLVFGEISIKTLAPAPFSVRLTISHKAAFEAALATMKGPLPKDVEAMSALAQLRSVLDERLAA